MTEDTADLTPHDPTPTHVIVVHEETEAGTGRRIPVVTRADDLVHVTTELYDLVAIPSMPDGLLAFGTEGLGLGVVFYTVTDTVTDVGLIVLQRVYPEAADDDGS